MGRKMTEIDKLFESKVLEKALAFYDHFNNANELLEWLKNRPKARTKIYTNAGSPEITVVIPTKDHNGGLSKNCKRIYRNMRIVFVESRGEHFNLSHSYNVGIRNAMRYNPKWIILSNDDVYKIDVLPDLAKKLFDISNHRVDVIGLEQDMKRFSRIFLLAKTRLPLKLWRHLKGGDKKIYQIGLDKFNVDYEPIYSNLIARILNPFLRKDTIRFIPGTRFTFFTILSSDFVKKNGPCIFDELYPHDREDEDLQLRITRERCRSIDFKIGHYRGRSLGLAGQRRLSKLISLFYLNYKIKRGLLKPEKI